MSLVSFASIAVLALPVVSAQEVPLFSSKLEIADALGSSAALQGDLAVLGAPGQSKSGSVFVFRRAGGQWTEEVQLKGGGVSIGADLGWSVALDGDTFVAGAPQHNVPGIGQAGLVVVYRHDGSGWSLEAKFSAPAAALEDGQRFGSSVAILGDRMLIGAPGQDGVGPLSGTAFLYTRTGTSWDAGVELTNPASSISASFGWSVALDAGRALVGAPGELGGVVEPGAAYLFAETGGSWSLEATLSAAAASGDDEFGASVALRGDEAVVGAPETLIGGLRSGAAFVFADGASGWAQVQRIEGPDPSDLRFAESVALGQARLLVGQPDGAGGDGVAHLYARGLSEWRLDGTLVATDPSPNEEAGASVALDGATALLGAPGRDLGLGFNPGMRCLAFDSSRDSLFTVGDFTPDLIDLDPFPGSSVVGAIGVSNGTSIAGMAHDPVADVFYAADNGNDQLLAIDPDTAAVTVIGPLGFTGVRGLAFDPIAGVLYGADNASDQLIQIDTVTGSGTAIGALGFDRAHALACDPTAGQLFGSDGDRLYRIDPTTGQGLLIGSIGGGSIFIGDVKGLAYDTAAGLLYATYEVSLGVPSVMTLQTATGLIMDFDPIHIAGGGAGLVFELDPAVSYCTAGTSASGCLAAIGAAGVPSATATSGFDLTVDGVEGAKRGLFFFGVNGRQAAPWGNSTSFQCVVPPVARTPLLNEAGTTGFCDGAQALDLNAHFQSKPASNPGPGVLVQAQYWYRDPFGGTNVKTSLSDALEFVTGP